MDLSRDRHILDLDETLLFEGYGNTAANLLLAWLIVQP
jgi:hypothetical protein